MIVFFEPSDQYDVIAHLLAQHQLPAQGWRDFEHFSDRLRCAQPKMVLLGLTAPFAEGWTALRTLKEKFPRTKAIVVASCPQAILKAFRTGADGCLMASELPLSVPYLQSVLEDRPDDDIFMSRQVKRAIAMSFLPFERVELNTRERQIVRLAANDKTVPQIAELLSLSAKTVESYLKAIKAKMSCHTIQGVVAKAFRHQVILMEEA